MSSGFSSSSVTRRIFPALILPFLAACAGTPVSVPGSGDMVLAGVQAQNEADSRAFRRFFDGEMKLRTGDIPGAQSDFEDAARFDPASSEIQLRLAQIHQMKGELEQAEGAAKEAVRLDVRNVTARLKYAQLLTARGALSDAADELDAALKVEPGHIQALLQKGSLEASLGRLNDAADSFDEVLDYDPGNAVALFSVAQIRATQGKFEEAEAYYRETIAAAPRFKRAYVDLFLLYEQYGEKKKALDMLRILTQEIDPDNEELRRLYSSALINQGDLQTAVTVLEKERQMQPGNLDVLARLGYAYFEQKNYESAIEEFRLVLARDPNNEAARYYLAVSLDSIGQSEAAEAEFVRIKPGTAVYTESLLYRAFVLEKLQRQNEAVDSLRQAIAQYPDETRFPEYLAALHLRLRQTGEGIRVAREALQKFPLSIRLRIVLAYLLEKEDFDASIRVMQEVLAKEPKNAEALNFIGYSWADRGVHLEEAEKLIRQALELQPDDGNITDSLGWVLFRQAKFAEALEVLHQAADMSPGVSEIRDHLGDAYLATGEIQKAVEAWKQSLDLNPDPDLKARIEKKIRDHEGRPEPKKAPKKPRR